MLTTTISLHELFSEPRLSSYYKLLGSANESDCLAFYLQALEASSKMLNIFNLIEIIFRNRLNNQIKAMAQTGALPLKKKTAAGTIITSDTWYESVTDGFGLSPKLANEFNKSHRKIIRLKSQRFPPKTPDDFIAQLDFGYYIYLLHRRHADSKLIYNYIWQPGALQNVFPGIVTKPRKLHGLFGLLLQCDDMRNRLCHHEPMWKGKIIRNKYDAYQNIRLKFNLLFDVLELLSPDMKEIVIDTELLEFSDVNQLFVSKCIDKYTTKFNTITFI